MANTLVDVKNPVLEEKLKSYKEYKALSKQVDSAISELAKDIKDILAELGETNIVCGSHECSLSSYNSETFNKAYLAENYPEIYKECVTTANHTRFLVK